MVVPSDTLARKTRRPARVRSVRPIDSSKSVAADAPVALHRFSVLNQAIVEEARRSGLLDGEKSEHVSFRAPPALVHAAKRATGLTSTSELGLLALAMLAQPDPVVEVMTKTRGALGEDHRLDY